MGIGDVVRERDGERYFHNSLQATSWQAENFATAIVLLRTTKVSGTVIA